MQPAMPAMPLQVRPSVQLLALHCLCRLSGQTCSQVRCSIWHCFAVHDLLDDAIAPSCQHRNDTGPVQFCVSSGSNVTATQSRSALSRADVCSLSDLRNAWSRIRHKLKECAIAEATARDSGWQERRPVGSATGKRFWIAASRHEAGSSEAKHQARGQL